MNKTKDAGTREEGVGDREVVRGDRKVYPVEGQVVEEESSSGRRKGRRSKGERGMEEVRKEQQCHFLLLMKLPLLMKGLILVLFKLNVIEIVNPGEPAPCQSVRVPGKVRIF